MEASINAARIRAEAIREFAEELKARAEAEYYHGVETNRVVIYRIVYTDDVDDLVAEMTGATESD